MAKQPNGEFKIEKGVPIPQGLGHGGPAPKYPFARMKPGDSVLLPGMTRHNANARVTYWRHKLGWKFTSRSVPGGIRVWRIE